MKITVLGIIQTLKNLGLFFMAYQVSDIRADVFKFLYALGIYACISIPTDLYLLNRTHENASKEKGKIGE